MGAKEISGDQRSEAAQESPQPVSGSEPAAAGLVAEARTWHALWTESRAAWKILLLVLTVSVIVRFYKLGNPDVWMDEIAIKRDALAGTFKVVSRSHLVHLRAVGWILNHVTDSVVGLRLWGAALGSLTAPAMLLAGTWLRSRRLGLILGLLTALNPFLIFYSQDANYYGPMSFFAAAQLALFIAFFRGAPLISVALIAAIGAVSHYNHPFGSIFTGLAIAVCAVGSLLVPSLRHEMHAVDPRKWPRRPALPIVALVILFMGPAAWGFLRPAYVKFGEIVQFGSTFTNIRFGWPFFHFVYQSFGVTFFHPGDLANVLTYPILFAAIGGVIALILRANKERPDGPLAVLMIIVPLLSFIFIFNVRAFRNFNLRYFTYQVPLFIMALAIFSDTAGAWIAARFKKPERFFVWCMGGTLLAVNVAYTLHWHLPDKSNYRTMAGVLAEERRQEEPIYLPLLEERVQAGYYFSRTDPKLWPGVTTNLFLDPRANYMARTYLVHKLYGEDSAWIATAWRHPVIDAAWNLLQDAVPAVYRGISKSGPNEDAILYHWTYEDRVLFQIAATRFTDQALFENGESSWLIEGEGAWRIDSVGEDSPAPAELGLMVTGPGTSKFTQDDGSILVSAAGPVSADVRVFRGEPVEFQATPVFPGELSISAAHTALYVDDPRIEESRLDGQFAMLRRYDGPFSYLLWVDPEEDRQLVLRAGSRPEHDLWLEVAVDGVHQGFWMIPAAAEELVRLPTALDLPPGNHRIDVVGFALDVVYNPEKPWKWAGLEWNAGEPEPPVPSLEQRGLTMAQFGAEMLPWGEPGATGLPYGYGEYGTPSYTLNVSEDVTGPSGLPALEVHIDQLRGPASGYHVVYGPLVNAQPGQVIAFSTYFKCKGNITHDAATCLIFANENGEMIGNAMIGNQQKIGYRYGRDWFRFIHVAPIPQGVGAVAPAIAVFPPDPKDAQAAGTIWVDALSSLAESDGPYRDPFLPQELFWEPGTE